MQDPKPNVVTAEAFRELAEIKVEHPLNPNGECHYRTYTPVVGLQRLGVHRLRIPPGREANEVHTHTYEEEFYFVLSGRGIALINGEEIEIGPGDFLGFPAPSVPHLLTNPFDEDLEVLAAGERRGFEVAEFPRHGKTLLRAGDRGTIVDSDCLKHFSELWKRADGR